MNNSDLSVISQVTDHIYLSGIYPLERDGAGSTNMIDTLGIKYIVCCVSKDQADNVHDKITMKYPHITVLYIPLDDIIEQNLWLTNKNAVMIKSKKLHVSKYHDLYKRKPMIEIGYHFINQIVDSQDKVLVHCMAGISRSVSMVVYYLMKRYHLNFDDAIDFVKRKRKIANPNSSFKLQLKLYHVKRDQFDEKDAEEMIKQAV